MRRHLTIAVLTVLIVATVVALVTASATTTGRPSLAAPAPSATVPPIDQFAASTSDGSSSSTSPPTKSHQDSSSKHPNPTPPTRPAPATPSPASVSPATVDFGVGTTDLPITVTNGCAAIAQYSIDTATSDGLPTVTASPDHAPLAACESIKVMVHVQRTGLPEGPLSSPITVTIGAAKLPVLVKAVVNQVPRITHVDTYIRNAQSAPCPVGPPLGSVIATIVDANLTGTVLHTIVGAPDGSRTEHTIAMGALDGDRWTAGFGPYPQGSSVSFWVEAVDSFGATTRTAMGVAC